MVEAGVGGLVAAHLLPCAGRAVVVMEADQVGGWVQSGQLGDRFRYFGSGFGRAAYGLSSPRSQAAPLETESMREVELPDADRSSPTATFRACLAAILEVSAAEVPELGDGEDVAGWRVVRWLGGLGIGIVPVRDPATFAWAGPWISLGAPDGDRWPHAVVMYGVPSGVAWDPAGPSPAPAWRHDRGFVLAALDIALARPSQPEPIAGWGGSVEGLWLASVKGRTPTPTDEADAVPGRGLRGDRHFDGLGTFPSGLPGSALTLIESEVCESFTPPLEAWEHRRNLVTRGVRLNQLVGRDFTIGEVRCRGARLCEPCKVIADYAARPVLRPLVHRGGLRADILSAGVIRLGDRLRPM